MSYSSQFQANLYTVPVIFAKDWTDVSYGNDTCPHFINTELNLAVWLDADDPEYREFNAFDGPYEAGVWKRLNVMAIDGEDILFSTEDEEILKVWLGIYKVKMDFDSLFTKLNNRPEPNEELADEVIAVITMANEMLARLK